MRAFRSNRNVSFLPQLHQDHPSIEKQCIKHCMNDTLHRILNWHKDTAMPHAPSYPHTEEEEGVKDCGRRALFWAFAFFTSLCSLLTSVLTQVFHVISCIHTYIRTFSLLEMETLSVGNIKRQSNKGNDITVCV